jgi:hypothetical protein
MPYQGEWMKLSELLKRLNDQKERQAAMREARDRNNRNAHGQDVFRHRDLTPIKPAKLGF